MHPSTRRQASHPATPAADTLAGIGATARQPPRRRHGIADRPSVVVAIAGLWLASAPFLLHYGRTDGAFAGRWNDLLVGVAMMLVAVVRIVVPSGAKSLSFINLILGLWLIAAPFVLGHGGATGAVQATWNDVVVGVIVVMVAGVGVFTADGTASSENSPR